MKVTHETKLSAAIDGKKTQGMLVLAEATRIANEKAKEHGFGICRKRRQHVHADGRAGYYCKKVADEGMIAICMAQSPEFVAPAGSSKAIFGTNPIGVGIPSAEGSMVLDMATSAYSWFKRPRGAHGGQATSGRRRSRQERRRNDATGRRS